MKQTDFEYDGRLLSDYGFIVCSFNSSGGVDEVSAGSTIVFEKIPRNNGKKFGLVHTKHTECLKSEFDICKNPDLFTDEEMEITQYEFREIMRWLNRKEFLPFHIISDGCSAEDSEPIYHNASFNISKIMFDERLVGIRLKMETDMPFGYGEEKVYSWDTALEGEQKIIYDMSDEVGYTYPSITLRCKVKCDLVIENLSIGCAMVVKNCEQGEVISVSGDTNIISSSVPNHDICNDFNYEFLRISNDIDRTQNIISVSHPCYVEMRYHPIIKFTHL